MDNQLIMVVYDFLKIFVVCGMIITGVLWVTFSWITMRKLRKNPEIKGHLGAEFISGYDAFNVAHTFVFDKYRNKKVKSSLDVFDADLTLIYKYTTRFDRLLGRIFCFVGVASTLLLIPLVFIDFFIKQ